MFFPAKAKQICLDWPSLFSVPLGEEKSLEGQTSFMIQHCTHIRLVLRVGLLLVHFNFKIIVYMYRF